MKEKIGKLFVVGIGPGSLDEMTYHARRAIETSEVIVGYSAYIDLAEPLFSGKVVITGGMGMEVERCEAALREAVVGRTVALISSGDAGIYGMAGLVLEIAQKKRHRVSRGNRDRAWCSRICSSCGTGWRAAHERFRQHITQRSYEPVGKDRKASCSSSLGRFRDLPV